jgi:hypothetical protein
VKVSTTVGIGPTWSPPDPCGESAGGDVDGTWPENGIHLVGRRSA